MITQLAHTWEPFKGHFQYNHMDFLIINVIPFLARYFQKEEQNHVARREESMEPIIGMALDPIVGLDTIAFVFIIACFTGVVSGVQLFLLRALEKMI